MCLHLQPIYLLSNNIYYYSFFWFMVYEILKIIETLEVITELLMRMAVFGNIRTFESNREQYNRKIGLFFQANGITASDRKWAIFLTTIGPEAYKTLRNLITPAKIGDLSYTELVASMQLYYSPSVFQLDWMEIHVLQNSSLQNIIQSCAGVFKEFGYTERIWSRILRKRWWKVSFS